MGRSFKEDTRYLDEMTKISHKCKCGHSVAIFRPNVRKLCKWCGHYVYINKFEEKKASFKNTLRRMMRNDI